MPGVFKKSLKSVLHRAGLSNLGQQIYFNARTARPSVLKKELLLRTKGAPDGYPLPPPALVYDVIACRWGAVFLDSGRRVVDDMEEVLDDNRKPLSSFKSILDFGCGCGRLIRQLPARTAAALYGSDYNGRLVDWCAEHLGFARFSKNELAPPLPFAEGSFDFIYARSVFTHLPEELQFLWMDEFRRVLQKNGCLYLTMHGRPLLAGLSVEQLRQFDAGKLVVTYDAVAGENLCATYGSPAFVETRLSDGFRILEFIEGRDRPHLRQDIYLFQKC